MERNMCKDENCCSLFEPGTPVRLEIEDQNIGIPQKHLDMNFIPLDTTKVKGSGSGLTTARSIIMNHKGIGLVDTKLGNGSTFSRVLPTVKDEGHLPSTPKPRDDDIARKGRVLVMDDEEPLLDVLQIMLEDFGYQVVCVRTGEEAIIVYRDAISRGMPFQVVIMDLAIKGSMGGKDAIKEILALNPEARVIVSSGYSYDPIMAHPRKYGFWDALSKPFNMQDLFSKISTAMADDADHR